ncbi:BRCA1-associated RING domain protein 1 [Desmophyllum pertusum]|uniref:BRCA1-associated RING domain protein 1 n=1 Tax=Desmophyllum pertusum TaxID=174260 RepID=A0A9W9ZY28_9CNID|nr:BRCA1-associated RING domain protein 1 [Desmophyllum pertusum]
MIGWQNTRNALGKLEELLTCKVCNCVEKLVGADSKCPECGAFAWVKDMKTNRQLSNTVSMCAKIRMLVGSDDDDNNVKNKTHTSSTTAAVWEETQPTLDQETDSYQFSSPDIVLADKSMNKCDAAVQEISRNNKKIPWKEPVKIKTYSRAKTNKTVKAKIIRCTIGADHGEDRKQDGNSSGAEIVEQDAGKLITFQDGVQSRKQDDDINEIALEEGTCTTFSSNSRAAKRVQAKQKCFGKQLKKRRLKKTSSSLVSPRSDEQNREQNDRLLIENSDNFQFGSEDEDIEIADKDKENVNEKSFTRLRPRDSAITGSLMAMLNKGPLPQGTPNTVKGTPKTRAQKRNSHGAPLRSSLKTAPYNEPRDASRDLTSETMGNEQETIKMTKNDNETPVKPQGNNKRKMPGQNISSPKNSTFCSPAAKKNKRGETPLHVAAIKGCEETVRKLLAEGADPNTKDHAGWTPLHEACNHGYLTITKLLLDHGAMIDIPGGFDHDSPLHDAVTNGRLEVARLLVNKGAPLNVRNKRGLLPIDYAATEEMLSILSTSTPNTDNESSTRITSLLKGSHDSPKVLLATGLSSEQKVNLQKCARILNASIVNEFSLSVTHIVTSTNNKKGVCPRTIKYLNGVLTGKWIVDYEWILKSLRHKAWVDEAPHEVKGTNDAAVETPKRARINSIKQLPGLFDGCQFYFSGEFCPPHPSKEDLIQMVKYGGGKILSREPKPDVDESLCLPTTRESNKVSNHAVSIATVAYHANPSSKQYRCTQYIIYDSLAEKKPHIWNTDSVCSMPLTWLMDCASNFAVLDLE